MYNNENISVGIHGTALIKDENHLKAKDICNNGLMCRYGDIRRTVALQDRGYIHSHGNIGFEDLTHYLYGKDRNGYVYETIKEGKVISQIAKPVSLEQVSFVFAIPKELKTTDEMVFSGEKRRFEMDYAENEVDLRLGKNKQLQGRPINPKYIVGYYLNGDINTFQSNLLFFGFKQQEESKLPIIDYEKIAKVNEDIKSKNLNEEVKSTQSLGKETLDKQKDTKEKVHFTTLIKDLISKARIKNSINKNDMEETRE